ncbi:DUF1203 domain-containing protein [Catellatospora sp. NPDC049609]|uniref:DUF1203 domain-containing protein n=1 Tax=Catellatospora sp. NPDC049609 TaxID=3155505 RepID=UPI00343F61EA
MYSIHAIDPSVVAQLLSADDAGNPPELSVDVEGGAPLRCCLRRAAPGDRIALVAYEPLRRWAAAAGAEPGPYLERGPVFLHADGCTGPEVAPSYLGTAHRVFRCYDRDGRILGGRRIEPGEVHRAVFDELFADPAVALVHVRAVEYGCFLYESRRV